MSMGLDFYMYEDKSTILEGDQPHEIQEVLYLSNYKGMLLANWFYRKDMMKDVFGESSYYIEIFGDDLNEVISALELVLTEKLDWKKDLLAYHYFPVLYHIPNYISSVEMWSDWYYDALKEIYGLLKQIIPDESIYNNERRFFYNVSI